MAEFHEELKKIREDRGITRNQIIEVIKIRPDFLERLENGDLTFIPMPFVRGFIQEYAKVVGIEPSLALQRLDNKIPTLLTHVDQPEKKEDSENTVEPVKPESTASLSEDETPAKAKRKKASKAEEKLDDNVEEKAEETPEPPSIPQTSLFEESSKETEPAQEEVLPPHDEETSVTEEIPAVSLVTSPSPEDKTNKVAVPHEQAEISEELEKRVPLDIQEAESPGNVAFFIFIAALIILAVIILLMNRGSLF